MYRENVVIWDTDKKKRNTEHTFQYVYSHTHIISKHYEYRNYLVQLYNDGSTCASEFSDLLEIVVYSIKISNKEGLF